MTKKKRVMTNDDMLKRCCFYIDKWREIIPLRDWEINVASVKRNDMGRHLVSDEPFLAEIKGLSTEGKEAYILFTDRGDWQDNWLNRFTEEDLIESTIVHEIVHIFFYSAYFTVESYSPTYVKLFKDNIENSVEAVAQALIRADRGVKDCHSAKIIKYIPPKSFMNGFFPDADENTDK